MNSPLIFYPSLLPPSKESRTFNFLFISSKSYFGSSPEPWLITFLWLEKWCFSWSLPRVASGFLIWANDCPWPLVLIKELCVSWDPLYWLFSNSCLSSSKYDQGDLGTEGSAVAVDHSWSVYSVCAWLRPVVDFSTSLLLTWCLFSLLIWFYKGLRNFFNSICSCVCSSLPSWELPCEPSAPPLNMVMSYLGSVERFTTAGFSYCEFVLHAARWTSTWSRCLLLMGSFTAFLYIIPRRGPAGPWSPS